jgi:hypothetical protein
MYHFLHFGQHRVFWKWYSLDYFYGVDSRLHSHHMHFYIYTDYLPLWGKSTRYSIGALSEPFLFFHHRKFRNNCQTYKLKPLHTLLPLANLCFWCLWRLVVKISSRFLDGALDGDMPLASHRSSCNKFYVFLYVVLRYFFRNKIVNVCAKK